MVKVLRAKQSLANFYHPGNKALLDRMGVKLLLKKFWFAKLSDPVTNPLVLR